MPSLNAKDRAPLCLFTYEDGRRCRTPRRRSHPHFCFYHAQKESQSQATEKLSQDLAFFFSGDYLSANDLSTAMGRLIPAVVRGEIKPRLARTVAYMFQTQLQAIHLSQHEYINAFGNAGWRDAICSSVNGNHDYLSPPDPNAAEPHESESEESTQSPAHSAPEPAPPAPVGAGLARPDSCNRPASPTPPDSTAHPESPAPQPDAPPPPPPSSTRPSPSDTEAALKIARNLFPERPNPNPTQPSTDETHHSTLPAPQTNPTPNPATPTPATQSPDPTPPPQPPTPRRQPGAPTRDPYAVHFDHNYRLIVDGKPW